MTDRARTQRARSPRQPSPSVVPSKPRGGGRLQEHGRSDGQRPGHRNIVDLISLQNAAGNRAARAIVQRDRGRRDITFSDEEGTHLTTTESSPDSRLRTAHEHFGDALFQVFENCKDGLDNFETAMSFASEQESEAHLAEAMGKAFMKSLIDIAVDQVPSPGKEILKTAINVGMAAWAEEQRASGAAGERRVAAFISDVRTGLSNAQTTAGERHRAGLDDFLARYPGDRRARVVTEEEEVWIDRAEAQVNAMENATPSAQLVQQRLTERFVSTGAYVGLVTRGTFRKAGTLSINLRVTGSRGDGWSVASVDESWVLGTNYPKPGRVAQSLQDSLGAQGKSPMQSGLPVEIHIEAETSGETFEGTLKKSRGGRAVIDVSSYRLGEGGEAREVIRSVGRSGPVAVRLLGVTRVRGSSD